MIAAAIALTIVFWLARTVVRSAEDARVEKASGYDRMPPPAEDPAAEEEAEAAALLAADEDPDEIEDLEPEPAVSLPEDVLPSPAHTPLRAAHPHVLITDDRRLDDVLYSAVERADDPRHPALKLLAMIALLALAMGISAWALVRAFRALFDGFTGP